MVCTCKKCGNEFGSPTSLGTHLWKTHSMDPKTYYDSYLKKAGEGICPVCNGPTSFKSLGQGYKTWCSRKCAAIALRNDPERNKKKVAAMEATMLLKHGVRTAALVPEFVAKRKATMKDKYGVEYYSQSERFGEQYIETFMKRHGIKGPTGNPGLQAKIRESNMASKGVPYNFSINVGKATDEYTALLDAHGCELIQFSRKKSITYRCRKCGAVCTEQDLFIKSRIAGGRSICTSCDPKYSGISGEEIALTEYVKSLGFEVTHYDRGFVGQYGADIVIESKKVIIEYDGLHWHSELYVPYNYHVEKTELAKSMGYRLIHVFSDEWIYHREQVKSRLANTLGVIGERIFARKCNIVKPSYETTMQFVEENHTQGTCPFSQGYALEFGGRLVAAMTFSRSRFTHNRNDMELLRYCTLPGINVVGGASRLFSAFVREMKPSTVITYADRRWSPVSSFYEKLGFRAAGITHPAYAYVVGDQRVNRISMQKHRLVAEGADESKSAKEILIERGIYRIYDCGNFKYIWPKNPE